MSRRVGIIHDPGFGNLGRYALVLGPLCLIVAIRDMATGAWLSGTAFVAAFLVCAVAVYRGRHGIFRRRPPPSRRV